MLTSPLIIDNGAESIKFGFAKDKSPQVIPNCKMKVKSERQRQFIGDQIEDCKDCSGLYYILPHHKGFIINWDTQREIWDYLITNKLKDLRPEQTDLIITEPYFNFKAIQNNTDEVLFEEYNFRSILRTNTGYLSSTNHRSTSLACLVVDSGFSFTHIAPYVYHEKHGFVKLKKGIRRIDVGGKALTNHLKEIISYRQINVMDETYVINQCKEDVCFIATNLEDKLKECEQSKRNKIARDYILPDFTTVKRGYVRNPPDWRATTQNSELQFVRLANERFQVPEILFNPSDVGLNQVGIVEAMIDSINSLPKQLHHLLYENIVLTGGNTKIPGFKERVLRGVRTYCPNRFQVNVHLPDQPQLHAWYGGKELGSTYRETLEQLAITKKQYDEYGENKKQTCVDMFDT